MKKETKYKKARLEKGLKQHDVAIACNLSITGYCKIERGESVPNRNSAEKLKKVLGV